MDTKPNVGIPHTDPDGIAPGRVRLERENLHADAARQHCFDCYEDGYKDGFSYGYANGRRVEIPDRRNVDGPGREDRLRRGLLLFLGYLGGLVTWLLVLLAK